MWKCFLSEFIPMQQLKQLFLANAIPLIGFGFLDNALMIVAGEYLDMVSLLQLPQFTFVVSQNFLI